MRLDGKSSFRIYTWEFPPRALWLEKWQQRPIFIQPSFAAAPLEANLAQTIVLLQDFAQAVVGKSDYRLAVDAGHGFRSYERIDDGFLGGLNCGEEDGIQFVVGQQGNLMDAGGLARAGIGGGEGDEDVSGAIAGKAAVAAEAEGGAAGQAFELLSH